MSVSEDLINFDIIETHKENIQPLASGRSAKTLASTFAPTSRSKGNTPGDTRNLNDAIRDEYEQELRNILDSDDPLDIYDRYVKWTLTAYPSAQATPDSQLRQLLERATRAFQAASHYKNDPRYLKIWLHYVRLFSDAPRETFSYLSRHGIGEGLALFYEEFATWLESAGRWTQADEVLKLGIDKEARPTERLIRKYGEFQTRLDSRVIDGEEPSSPALPTIRPALAAKIDPFATSSPASADPQAVRPRSTGGMSNSRGVKQKLAVFSDEDDSSKLNKPSFSAESKGWDSIGTVTERKKENTVETRSWAGETLKSSKRSTGAPKMTVFKDESKVSDDNSNTSCVPKNQVHPPTINAHRVQSERVFVNLQAVYPDENNACEEMSFEELKAQARGWLDKYWTSSPSELALNPPNQVASTGRSIPERSDSRQQQPTPKTRESQLRATIAIDMDNDNKPSRPKKLRMKEIKGGTQTVRTNLESPTGPKSRCKTSTEPTMTLHTRAATDDILDIFNQPLRNHDPMAGPTESEDHTDCDDDVDVDDDDDDDDDDDGYTSGGESTGTGRISGTSDFGDTEPNIRTTTTNVDSAAETVSPWSDFTARKHVPVHAGRSNRDGACDAENLERGMQDLYVSTIEHENTEHSRDRDNLAGPQMEQEHLPTRYIPLPPEDYEPPTKHHRDPMVAAQSRMPFMTPIVEKTETSVGAFSFSTDHEEMIIKTPSRQDQMKGQITTPTVDGEPLSSPFQEVRIHSSTNVRVCPIIQDVKCNPVDESIRQAVLDQAKSSLKMVYGYHSYPREEFGRASEIRKFIKSLSKAKSSDKTTASLTVPPTLRFPAEPLVTYTIRRELGKGAFAPVYLAEQSFDSDGEGPPLSVAIKSEDPPTAWEFYIMNVLHNRLTAGHRVSTSLLQPHCLHLFRDEGYLVEQYLDQGTLLDLVNLAKSDPVSGQTTLEENVAMFFTVELLRIVEAMHSVGILHGDLKADNCLVRLGPPPGLNDDNWSVQYQSDGSLGWSSRGMTLIDFGRSIDMTAFRSDVQFIADWKTGKQDCIEMRELRPWTYQVDYYGIAGIVHSLLFGKYIEDAIVEVKNDSAKLEGCGERKRYRVKEPLKRYWQTELWTRLFDLALNPSCHSFEERNGSMPCTLAVNRIKADMEMWLFSEGCRKNGGLKNILMRLEGRTKERKGR